MLTTAYRANGKVRFEGVAERSLAGKTVRIYEIRSDELVATARVRRNGTWWTSASTDGKEYTWLTKFVAEAGRAQSPWHRLGQALGLRKRTPGAPAGSSRSGGGRGWAKIRVKVAGSPADRLIVGLQTGCSRNRVADRFQLEPGPDGVATMRLPGPPAGQPYAIYRVRDESGLKISPPIVVSAKP